MPSLEGMESLISCLCCSHADASFVTSQISVRWIMLIVTYYAPIYFEAALGHSATTAGLDLLGLVISLVLSNIIVGLTVRKIGNYKIFLIFGPMFAAVGSGLLYTVNEHTKFANVIGFEILCGIGIGSIMQIGMLGAQAEYAKDKAKMGRVMGALTLFQMAGGLIGLAIAGAVFNDELKANLAKCRSPSFCQFHEGQHTNELHLRSQMRQMCRQRWLRLLPTFGIWCRVSIWPTSFTHIRSLSNGPMYVRYQLQSSRQYAVSSSRIVHWALPKSLQVLRMLILKKVRECQPRIHRAKHKSPKRKMIKRLPALESREKTVKVR